MLGGATAAFLSAAATPASAAVTPAVPSPDPLVSLVHAVPGADPATLSEATSAATAPAPATPAAPASGSSTTPAPAATSAPVTAHDLGTSKFGEVSTPRPAAPGEATLDLKGSTGKTIATAHTRLTRKRRYTVVALPEHKKVGLHVYRDAARRSGHARLRVIHAAPELGRPDLWIGGRKIASRVPLAATTGYIDVPAGTALTLALSRPGNASDILLSKRLTIGSGEALTAIVLGTEGEKLRVVTRRDRPRAASSTGGWYSVRQGDSLWAIAERRLGAGADNADIARRVAVLWRANAARIGTGNPDLIRPGQRLHLA